MASYLLKQKQDSRDGSHQFEVLRDSEVVIRSCSYMQGINYIEQVMRPDDLYQEKGRKKFYPEMTYAEFMRNRELDRQFESGELH